MSNRFVHFGLLLTVSWCAMTFAHESGHLVGGWLSGGTLREASLVPWGMPYSIFDPDPHPLITLWCGPLLGVAFPLALALMVRRPWAWFVAHFCVLANGSYLALAWVSGDQFLDTPKLLGKGAHPATVAIYCVLTVGFGYVGFRKLCRRVLTSSSKGEGRIE